MICLKFESTFSLLNCKSTILSQIESHSALACNNFYFATIFVEWQKHLLEAPTD